MPVYNYQCPNCQDLQEVLKPIKEFDRPEFCPNCNGQMVRKLPTLAIHVFEPQWFEHIANEPIFIRSKRHLLEECKKHGKYSYGYG